MTSSLETTDMRRTVKNTFVHFEDVDPQPLIRSKSDSSCAFSVSRRQDQFERVPSTDSNVLITEDSQSVVTDSSADSFEELLLDDLLAYAPSIHDVFSGSEPTEDISKKTDKKTETSFLSTSVPISQAMAFRTPNITKTNAGSCNEHQLRSSNEPALNFPQIIARSRMGLLGDKPTMKQMIKTDVDDPTTLILEKLQYHVSPRMIEFWLNSMGFAECVDFIDLKFPGIAIVNFLAPKHVRNFLVKISNVRSQRFFPIVSTDSRNKQHDTPHKPLLPSFQLKPSATCIPEPIGAESPVMFRRSAKFLTLEETQLRSAKQVSAVLDPLDFLNVTLSVSHRQGVHANTIQALRDDKVDALLLIDRKLVPLSTVKAETRKWLQALGDEISSNGGLRGIPSLAEESGSDRVVKGCLCCDCQFHRVTASKPYFFTQSTFMKSIPESLKGRFEMKQISAFRSPQEVTRPEIRRGVTSSTDSSGFIPAVQRLFAAQVQTPMNPRRKSGLRQIGRSSNDRRF